MEGGCTMQRRLTLAEELRLACKEMGSGLLFCAGALALTALFGALAL